MDQSGRLSVLRESPDFLPTIADNSEAPDAVSSEAVIWTLNEMRALPASPAHRMAGSTATLSQG